MNMKRWSYSALLLLTTTLFFQDCQAPQRGVHFDPEQIPYAQLSEYGFFKKFGAQMNPTEGVLPYEPITTLFTDYAHKARFVWMPPGVQATVDSAGVINFPDHTVLIKHFYYPTDFAQPKGKNDKVETRLLVKRAGNWEAFTYVWNEAETDAELNLIGEFVNVAWTDAGQATEVEYVIPNKNQCKSCHNVDNRIQPIGPKVRYLQSELSYPDGSTMNQLAKWQAVGYLQADPGIAAIPALADWDDPESGTVEERAKAYLEVNCGHCHSSNGPAHTSGLFLQTAETDPGRWGICKNPVAAGKGSGNRQFGISPGNPDASILVFRMESEDPGVMMPELGRVLPHTEGIALVRSWIEGMEHPCEVPKINKQEI
ncbi:MAG: hypothetical protein KDC44_16210 [Phaeodactylibacter sp.]|nr:hypothetical protein [Phaeodactylibacter sp.]